VSAVLFLVPARAGSKGLPGKNLRTLAGIPLVGWAARAAAGAARLLGGGPHRVLCSTDDEAIAAAAREWGAETPFLRPAALATDTAGAVDVARHALEWCTSRGERVDAVALVQPTSPLALPEDLAAAVRAFLAGGAPVVSVSPTHPAAWTYALDGDRLRGTSAPAGPDRRQDHAPAFVPNGAVFVASPAHLRAGRDFTEPGLTRAVVMPAERGVDVDTEADLLMCEGLLAGRPAAPVRIGARTLGGGAPCFVIAEAGVNHDGDVAAAHQLVDAAAEAGADAVKFQTWITEKLARPGARKAEYQDVNAPADTDQFTMLKRLELPWAVHAELQRHAHERGLVFLSTPDEIDSARFLAALPVPALKIGSAELSNIPYLRDLAALRTPILLSTGMGTMAEVARAVDVLTEGGTPALALLHCVSAYPAPEEEMNLAAMAAMRQAFGVPVGLSDHTTGTAAAVVGAGLGMALLEKHLTLDRARTGPDHAASADPATFREMVGLLRRAEALRGDGRKRPTPSEVPTAAAVRRTLLYARDLPAGHVLGPSDFEALRSGDPGLGPEGAERLGGRVLARAVRSGTAVADEHLQ
jgi:N-acetylneuraminate synthase/N,N'-diacetyllegionaminate synthase